MPYLRQVRYSHEQCITAVQDFYSLLTRLFLDEADVLTPPPGGWSNITSESLAELEKNDTVIKLLRGLPYVRFEHLLDEPCPVPRTWFADWASNIPAEFDRLCQTDNEENIIPPHVFALTSGVENGWHMFIDTNLGIVHWPDCPDLIRDNASREPILNSIHDYSPESELEWRDHPGCTWAISDFFQLLKDLYKNLLFIPLPNKVVKFTGESNVHLNDRAIQAIKDVYRQHGWPNVEQFDKHACRRDIEEVIREHCGEFARWYLPG